MKSRNVLKMWFGGMALMPVMAFAQGGHVGGGDTCRDEIGKHRETIYQWIQSGDASDLDFSQSKTSVRDFSEYQKRMLNTLASGKVVVTCYLDPARIQDPAAQKIANEQGVSYRAITLTNPTTGQVEPTACINYEDQTGVSHIDCNYDSIVNQKALEDPNYQLTHHEYASIAGVELRKTDSEPDFTISRQLSQYEKWVKVKRLGRKKVLDNSGISKAIACELDSPYVEKWSLKRPLYGRIVIYPSGKILVRKSVGPISFTGEMYGREGKGLRWTGMYRFVAPFSKKSINLEKFSERIQFNEWDRFENFSITQRMAGLNRTISLLMPPIETSTRKVDDSRYENKLGVLNERILSSKKNKHMLTEYNYTCRWREFFEKEDDLQNF
jgi:hypothetical protein